MSSVCTDHPVKGEGDIRLFTILLNLKFKFGNFGKRIIKNLKIGFLDSAIGSFLVGVSEERPRCPMPNTIKRQAVMQMHDSVTINEA